MKYYHYYSRTDKDKEPIFKVFALSRYKAATHFAQVKRLSLKQFLKLYVVSR